MKMEDDEGKLNAAGHVTNNQVPQAFSEWRTTVSYFFFFCKYRQSVFLDSATASQFQQANAICRKRCHFVNFIFAKDGREIGNGAPPGSPRYQFPPLKMEGVP